MDRSNDMKGRLTIRVHVGSPSVKVFGRRVKLPVAPNDPCSRTPKPKRLPALSLHIGRRSQAQGGVLRDRHTRARLLSAMA